MTPRRVKRRSTRSKRGSNGRATHYQNPVTRLLDRSLDTSSNDSYAHFAGGQCNPVYLGSRSSLHSLYGKANPNVTSRHENPPQLPARHSTRASRHPYANNSETVI